jgi:hypothetical protein
MIPRTHELAERLRAALAFHSRRAPQHRGPAGRGSGRPRGGVPQKATPPGTPGEEFAQRLRAAIDA